MLGTISGALARSLIYIYAVQRSFIFLTVPNVEIQIYFRSFHLFSVIVHGSI